jgi:hypothetical protein
MHTHTITDFFLVGRDVKERVLFFLLFIPVLLDRHCLLGDFTETLAYFMASLLTGMFYLSRLVE